MELVNFNPAPGKSLGEHLYATAARVHELAKDGAPYCHSHVAVLLARLGRPVNPLEDLLKETALVMDELLAQFGWYRHPAYPWFAKSIKRTTLPLVLSFAVPPGIGQSYQSLGEAVRILTGEAPTTASMRKAISRLAEQGVYQRVGEGRYAHSGSGA